MLIRDAYTKRSVTLYLVARRECIILGIGVETKSKKLFLQEGDAPGEQ